MRWSGSAAHRPLDAVLALGAEAAADEFERTSALRLPIVMADVRAAHVAGVPTLVEGPQLHPRAAATWSPVGAIWLVTTAERTRAARRQRLLRTDDDAARRRVDALVERDQVIGARLRSAAREAGHALVEVPTDVDWTGVVAAVRQAVEAVTAPFDRLAPGAALSSRRRHENDVVLRQIVAHERHIGATLPPFPYACVCGRSGCTDTVSATSAEYRASGGQLTL
ncbi:hypothetical protein [Virgisporangium ochraceum]|uniref:hypothetical protein n=1 Tax=Virgisporangium ochraceum TaxID=65505 RepID=UPI001945AD10|nr:hypothetical protein [Virgisporangium ochraceum]